MRSVGAYITALIGRNSVFVSASLAAVLLAGCQTRDDYERYATAAAEAACPAVRLLAKADTVTFFGPDGGEDLTDMVAKGNIADFSGGCDYTAGGVDVEMNLALTVEAGPAFSGADQPLSYFVAILDPTEQVVIRQAFDTVVEFADGSALGGTRQELFHSIPLADPANGPAHTILIGFRLTPAQLAYNRRTGAR